MTVHELKSWPEHFQPMWLGRKTWELRIDDRDPRFEVEDILLLKEWDPRTETYTGRTQRCIVLQISRNTHVIPKGYCIMSVVNI